MKRFFLLFAIASSCGLKSFSQNSGASRYIKTPTGYLMVLRQGDQVFKEIEKLAVTEKIPSASFTGMGFVNAQFGFFDFKSKTYKPKNFRNVEMASMTGSIAWQEEKPSLHVHAVATDKSFKAWGGHLLSAEVSTGSLEITVIVHEKNWTGRWRSRREQTYSNLSSTSALRKDKLSC